MGQIIPYIMENKNHVWNHQPVSYVLRSKMGDSENYRFHLQN